MGGFTNLINDMLRDTPKPVIESEPLAPNQLSSPNLVASLGISERHHYLRRCVGTLAIASAVWVGPAMGSDIKTLEAASELAIHDAQNVIWQSPPQLEYQSYSANQAIAKTDQAFHLHGGFYIDKIDSTSGFAPTWPQYQALNMLELANILEPNQGYDQKFNQGMAALDTYWSDLPSGYPAGYDAVRKFLPGPSDRYVDDNLWVAQEKMKQHQKTGDQADINRVRQIMDLFLSQQQPDGGAYWKVQLPSETDRGRVMASNATAIPTLIELYLANPADTKYLDAAQKTFDWIQGLYDPATGLYFDSIGTTGQIDKTFYTYNQAEVLYSLVELNKVDPVNYSLNRAVDFAQTSMDYFASHDSYGLTRFDVIYLRVLMQLASQVNDQDLTTQVQQSLALARKAIYNSPTSLVDAASSAAILALAQLPFDKWTEL